VGGVQKTVTLKLPKFEKTYAIYYGGKHYNFGVSYLLVTQEVGKRHEAQRLEKGGKQKLVEERMAGRTNASMNINETFGQLFDCFLWATCLNSQQTVTWQLLKTPASERFVRPKICV